MNQIITLILLLALASCAAESGGPSDQLTDTGPSVSSTTQSICTEGDPNCGDPGGGGPGATDVGAETEQRADSIVLSTADQLQGRTWHQCWVRPHGGMACHVELDFGDYSIVVSCEEAGPGGVVLCQTWVQ